LAEVGKQYAIYFTGDSDDKVGLDLTGASGIFNVQWLHADTSTWQTGNDVQGGKSVIISAPSSDEWAVIITSISTPPPPTSNSADINSDGKVDVTDLGILLSGWGGSGSADINNDGKVDVVDLGILLSGWS